MAWHQCKKDYPQKYTINKVNGDMKKVDYYDIILKEIFNTKEKWNKQQ